IHIRWSKSITAYNARSFDRKFRCRLFHEGRRGEIGSETTNAPESGSRRRWIEYIRCTHCRLGPGCNRSKVARVTGGDIAEPGVTEYIKPSVHSGCRGQRSCVKRDRTRELNESRYWRRLSCRHEPRCQCKCPYQFFNFHIFPLYFL